VAVTQSGESGGILLALDKVNQVRFGEVGHIRRAYGEVGGVASATAVIVGSAGGFQVKVALALFTPVTASDEETRNTVVLALNSICNT
jgi:hypothetical protein